LRNYEFTEMYGTDVIYMGSTGKSILA
jgi:hypothetical protein